MKSSAPLQLKYYCIESVLLESDGSYAVPPDERLFAVPEGQFDAELELARQDSDKKSVRVTCTIFSKPGFEGKSPWKFRIKMQGYFELSEAFMQNPEHENLATVNGGSILFSAAREILMSLSGHGPGGNLFLPSVRFGPSAPVTESPESRPAERRKSPSETTRSTT